MSKTLLDLDSYMAHSVETMHAELERLRVCLGNSRLSPDVRDLTWAALAEIAGELNDMLQNATLARNKQGPSADT